VSRASHRQALQDCRISDEKRPRTRSQQHPNPVPWGRRRRTPCSRGLRHFLRRVMTRSSPSETAEGQLAAGRAHCGGLSAWQGSLNSLVSQGNSWPRSSAAPRHGCGVGLWPVVTESRAGPRTSASTCAAGTGQGAPDRVDFRGPAGCGSSGGSTFGTTRDVGGSPRYLPPRSRPSRPPAQAGAQP
jgi:hypothetical protein